MGNFIPAFLAYIFAIAASSSCPKPEPAAEINCCNAAGSGLGQEDDAAVAKIYARNAGIKLPQN